MALISHCKNEFHVWDEVLLEEFLLLVSFCSDYEMLEPLLHRAVHMYVFLTMSHWSWRSDITAELVKSAAGAHEGKSGQESCTRDSHTCQDYFYNTYQSYLLASDACFLVTPPAVTETPVW